LPTTLRLKAAVPSSSSRTSASTWIALIRKALPNAAIQHFIHVPVAPWDVLQLLLTDEWARILTENGQPLGERMLYETLVGWIAADTLMVHRGVDQANLLEAIARVLGPHGYRG